MSKIKGWKKEKDTIQSTYWYHKPSNYVEIDWDGYDYKLTINNKVVSKSYKKELLKKSAINYMKRHPNG